MADRIDYSEAIANTSETLLGVLQTGLQDLTPPVLPQNIVLAAPNAADGENGDLRLTVYLYRISENASLKNTNRQQVASDTAIDPPLTLDLHYLLTAHPSTGETPTKRTVDQHKVLGRAMQVMHDNSVIRGSALKGSLAEGRKLHVSMNPDISQSDDGVLSLWSTFGKTAYQPSVSYLVTPVSIDSEREEQTHRVVETEERYYVESANQNNVE